MTRLTKVLRRSSRETQDNIKSGSTANFPLMKTLHSGQSKGLTEGLKEQTK